jgi:hypothetical protein
MEVAFKTQRGLVEQEQAEHLEQADMLARCKMGYLGIEHQYFLSMTFMLLFHLSNHGDSIHPEYNDAVVREAAQTDRRIREREGGIGAGSHQRFCS